MLEAFSLKDIDAWEPQGKYQILEPPREEPEGSRPDALLDPEARDSLDLVLVPGLAFDSQCRRLGQGAG